MCRNSSLPRRVTSREDLSLEISAIPHNAPANHWIVGLSQLTAEGEVLLL
jgi:hypothetical protein